MMNTTKITFVFLLIFVFVQCQKYETANELNNNETIFAQLCGKEYLFNAIKSPTANSAITEKEQYTIKFSGDGTSIDFINYYLSGSLVNDVEDKEYLLEEFIDKQAIAYNLSESTFAGGKFVVWYENNSFYAQLTIFGSGVPVIYHGEGNLVPVE